jgi:uncharacterized small protein (DUF1192 family)
MNRQDMDEDDKPTLKNNVLAALSKEDLDPYSVADLHLRIEKLKREIDRSTQMIDAKKNIMGTAHNLFKS